MTDDPAEPVWPVDLDQVRLWPMEGEDGPLLQELLDDLRDRTVLGEPGAADAVSTYIALPEGYGYESKLLVGIWGDAGLAGALDCIIGYPRPECWTVGLLVVADGTAREASLPRYSAGWSVRRSSAVPGSSGVRCAAATGLVSRSPGTTAMRSSPAT